MLTPNRRDFMQYAGTAAAGAFLGFPSIEAEVAAMNLGDLDRSSPLIYLTLDGVEGDARRKGHEGEIACFAARCGVGTDDTSGPARGRPPHRGHVTVLKAIDKSTPVLYEAAVSGEGIRSGALTLYRQTSTGELKPYYTIDLTGIEVASLEAGQHGAENFERCRLLVERFSFKPERVEDA
jgi:type VI secretion system Hcp family effector